jgi:hypothetical protein
MDYSEIIKQVDTVAYSRWPMRQVTGYSFSFEELQKFVDLVAAAEREACAKAVETDISWPLWAEPCDIRDFLAEAIRARK